MNQETVLLNSRVRAEEHKVYNEKCEVQQKSNDTNVPNVTVENVTQEEDATCKSSNDGQQLPSSENFAHSVSSDMEEEKSSSAQGSLTRNHTEDVFLPITTSQVKYFLVVTVDFSVNTKSAFAT